MHEVHYMHVNMSILIEISIVKDFRYLICFWEIRTVTQNIRYTV